MAIFRWIPYTFVFICCTLLLSAPLRAAEANTLRVGVAKLEITPQNLAKVNPNDFGDFVGVHDPIFARVLLLDNGRNTAALLSLDLNQTGNTDVLRARIQKELGIPADNVMVSITHNHSAPMIGRPSPGSVAKSMGPEIDAYSNFVSDRIVAALKQAKAALQPARLGYGAGRADVNVNRDLYTPKGYVYGHNLDGPSDKTVWVQKFETLSGEPIAVLFNYGVHPVTTRREKMISGDLPGAAERYVEQSFGNKVVALYTMGPAGDQDPKIYDLPPGGSSSAAKDPHPGAFEIMNAQGFMIGAEAVRVANEIKPSITSVKLEASQRVFTCPFKPDGRQVQYFQPGDDPARLPGMPVRLGLILIDRVALAAVSGEVLTNVYFHLRRSSPLSNTILVSMANDSSGYLVEDAAYDKPSSPVRGTAAARGCVEDGIVNGMTEMIDIALRK
jgi:hypothetical protein